MLKYISLPVWIVFFQRSIQSQLRLRCKTHCHVYTIFALPVSTTKNILILVIGPGQLKHYSLVKTLNGGLNFRCSRTSLFARQLTPDTLNCHKTSSFHVNSTKFLFTKIYGNTAQLHKTLTCNCELRTFNVSFAVKTLLLFTCLDVAQTA